jgi:fatty acid synthase subunit alpha, fungi type
MNSTNILAGGIEKHGVRTFSAKEMGFNILGLMHPILAGINSVEPLWADLSGGMLLLPQLNQIMEDLRKEIMHTAEVTAAICKEKELDSQVINGKELRVSQKIEPRANFKFEFPKLNDYDDLQKKLKLRNKTQDFNLQNMVDLEKTVVIVGFAEVGPWGSSRTRWEMESKGTFSITGCLELARMMGYVKFFNGKMKDGKPYIGWIETADNQPISDAQIKEKFEPEILKHTGIRMIGRLN